MTIPSALPEQRLAWLQALRGVAALMVLFFHLVPHWEVHELLRSFTGAMRWGFSGVDVFFALSGFVVYRAAKKAVRDDDLRTFAQHRLLRIYLGYWPALALFAFVSLVLLNRAAPPTGDLLRSITLLEPQVMKHWLLPAWSLTLELYFYFGAVVLVVVGRRQPAVAVALAILFLVAWNMAWLTFDTIEVVEGRQPLRYVFTVFAVEFFAGSLLAELWDQAQPQLARAAAIVLPVALAVILLALGIGVGSNLVNIETLRVATFGFAAIALLVVFLCLQTSGLRPAGWLVKVGDASYSLYLVHTPLLDIFATFAGLVNRKWPGMLMPYLLAVPVLIVLISLAWYRSIERPLLKWALKRWAPAPMAVAARET